MPQFYRQMVLRHGIRRLFSLLVGRMRRQRQPIRLAGRLQGPLRRTGRHSYVQLFIPSTSIPLKLQIDYFITTTLGACSLPRVSGPCEGNYPSWYHDTLTGSCRQFRYGGCLGNSNRFATKEECAKQCVAPTRLGIKTVKHIPIISLNDFK